MKFWIKLWIETLHDPKVACLPDRLWRKSLESFMMAGEQDEDGFLPPLKEMAWILRVELEMLESALVELQSIGLLNVIDGRWFVVNFAERQRPSTSAERSKQHRKREKKSRYQGKLWDEQIPSETFVPRFIEEKRREEKRRGEEKESIITKSDDNELVQCPKCTAMVSKQHLNLDCLYHITTKEERQARHDYLERERVTVALETEPAGIDGNPDEED